MTPFSAQCPLPLNDFPQVLLAHGGGGRLSDQLISKMFRSVFSSDDFQLNHDAAFLDLPSARLAMSTDSFVVSPLFFPGGDIGKLAVYGTVNDLSMAGARPLYLSLAFILEEGLAMEDLWKIVCSIRQAADECGVRIVTGDTKVVEKGKGDAVFINTTGIGLRTEQVIGPQNIEEGDAIIVNGDLGRHGMAILSARENLGFDPPLESDCANLSPAVEALQKREIELHCLRDLTRGGLSSALFELATESGFNYELEGKAIPISDEVKGAVEILGLDPYSLANEGRFCAFLPQGQVETALELLRTFPHFEQASCIGHVLKSSKRPSITVKTSFGSSRSLDYPRGEQLPRIC